ncbi:ATP-binding protein [Ruminococcus sp.]|uniref:sensor histidine kinase n=1 Tax=Ruminococcus sp. TaxID=41978 RepID=UPI002CBC9775|nr:ATP-binding protein [Ruminococcus sp.]HNZ98783.1 ATP-binding protein [Ruminococcus sp.]HOH87201.1 ATP-binding protein [Ruminococcus sp.]
MKLWDYLKDRLWFFFIAAVSLGLMLLFLTAFRVSGQLTATICVIFGFFLIAEETAGFLRKKRFYDDMQGKLDGLDKKYLIHEMLKKPSFLDGQILFDALCEANKSMCENVAEYKRTADDFREFIEMWVHEIKLPVASLQLMAHNHSDELGEKFQEQLRRIDGYTDQVLYYARSENAEKDYIIKETPLRRTVANVALKNRESAQLCGAFIETEGLDLSVMTDGKWLEFMLGQLMANSLKYTVEGREPVIRISAEELPDRVLLHFRDNGTGIPEADLPRIFDKSFTGENGRSYAKSTGMGLYIVRSLCERLGHSITASSVKGEYTEFTIAFAKNQFYKMI